MVAISLARKVLPGGHLHSELGTSENSERDTQGLSADNLSRIWRGP